MAPSDWSSGSRISLQTFEVFWLGPKLQTSQISQTPDRLARFFLGAVPKAPTGGSENTKAPPPMRGHLQDQRSPGASGGNGATPQPCRVSRSSRANADARSWGRPRVRRARSISRVPFPHRKNQKEHHQRPPRRATERLRALKRRAGEIPRRKKLSPRAPTCK